MDATLVSTFLSLRQELMVELARKTTQTTVTKTQFRLKILSNYFNNLLPFLGVFSAQFNSFEYTIKIIILAHLLIVL